MTDTPPPMTDTASPPPARAHLTLHAGPVRLETRLSITPAGLLAVGGLVSSILLSTAVVVWVSTSVARRHPLAAAMRR